MCGNPCAVQVVYNICSTMYIVEDEGQPIMPLRGKREKEKYGSTGEIQTIIGIGAETMGQPSNAVLFLFCLVLGSTYIQGTSTYIYPVPVSLGAVAYSYSRPHPHPHP